MPESSLAWGEQQIVRNVSSPALLAFPAAPEGNTGISVVIAPGGGFRFLAIDQEGTEVARWLNARGINAFVLKYRLQPTPRSDLLFKAGLIWMFAGAAINAWRSDDQLPDRPFSPIQTKAISDGLKAIAWVRENAEQWNLRVDSIGMLGFSAGGAVASGVAKQGRGAERADFVALLYAVPAAGEVPDNAAPLFIVTADDDPVVPASWSQALHEQWLAAGRESTLIRYPEGGHGFGLKQQGIAADQWIARFHEWLMR